MVAHIALQDLHLIAVFVYLQKDMLDNFVIVGSFGLTTLILNFVF